jgi:hypothetical protein
MKLLKLFTLVLLSTLMSEYASSQNISLNVLTQNSGIIHMGGTVFLEVTICNTNSSTSVPAYKLKPQISFPSQLLSIPDTGHILPAGWTIIFNKEGVVRLSNGNDEFLPNQCRTLLIAAIGKQAGGPSTISGNLGFANGVEPGTISGGPTKGDNPADNASTTTIKVYK